MKLYRQVSTKERLPENNKSVPTDKGNARYFRSLNVWLFNKTYCKPSFWLEELPELPTEEEIINKSADSNWSMEGFIEGANYILNLIKNK